MTKDGWALASEYRARLVTLNGVDVTDRCAGIRFRHEMPAAVKLYAVDPAGDFVFLPDRSDVLKSDHEGAITVDGLRRRTAA